MLFYYLLSLAVIFFTAFSFEVAGRGFALRSSCTQIRAEISLAINFTVANPYFYANETYFCKCFSKCIINVCTECMKWNTSVFISLVTCHFSTTEPAGDKHLNTFCSHPHCGCDCHFNGTTVRYFTFYLAGDVTCHYCCIKFRTFYFVNVYLNFFLGNLLEFFL